MKRRILTIFFVLVTAFAVAGVDPRHGLFYISYTDLEFAGGKADITRNYNSTRTTTGLFGYGWASFIETKITALPDGSINLSWWGGGAGDYYEPAVIDRAGLFQMINAIVKELIKNHKLDNNPAAIAEKKSYYLINNKERATKYVELFAKTGAASFVPLKKQKWLLDVNQVIEWNGSVFKVKSWNDSYEFNKQGRLIQINDKNYKMKLTYEQDALSTITVDDSSTCYITTDKKGRIIQLLSAIAGKQKKAVFTYDSTDNLIYSKDAGDNEYWYSYDLFHNMVQINYIDSTSLDITYDGATNRVIKLKGTNNWYSTYQYPYFYTPEGRVNYDHYATHIKQYDSAGNLRFSDYKEYENRLKDDGSSYIYRVLESSDTSYHEILYNGEVGNAAYRKKNKNEAWSTYDAKHRPNYLHIKDSIYKTNYNSAGLPEYFSEVDSLTNIGNSYYYSYNEDGQLIKIRRNDEIFTVDYHKENMIEIQKEDGTTLVIQQMPDSSYKLIADYSNSIDLSKEEWKKIRDSTLVKAIAGKIQSQVASDEGSRNEHKKQILREIKQAAIEKRVREGSQKTEDKKAVNVKKKAEELVKPKEISAEQLKQQLIHLYFNYSDILTPKKIEHEWIWQRL